jgi:hypothetical protein
MSVAKAQRLLLADDDADMLAAYVLFFEADGSGTRAAEALAASCQ